MPLAFGVWKPSVNQWEGPARKSSGQFNLTWQTKRGDFFFLAGIKCSDEFYVSSLMMKFTNATQTGFLVISKDRNAATSKERGSETQSGCFVGREVR